MPARTLCLDTSSRSISVALFEGSKIIAADADRGSTTAPSGSRSLTPLIEQLLAQAQWKIGQLERVVLPVGPGSFSGLRMGIVTAKVFGYSLGIPIYGLNTLEVIAFRAVQAEIAPPGSDIVALLDAQRGQLFAQPFQQLAGGGLIATAPRNLIAFDDLEARFPTEFLIGSGLKLLEAASRRAADFESPSLRWASLSARVAPESIWACDAVSVGLLAERSISNLKPTDHWSLVPDYGRPSAAEEKAIERKL